MPLNDLYTYSITLTEDTLLQATLTIDFNHRLFKGHFPGNPVLPGVVQLEIIRTVLESQLNRKLHLASARDIKYLHPIIPSNATNVSLECVYEVEGIDLKVKATLSAKDQTLTKLRGIYRGE